MMNFPRLVSKKTESTYGLPDEISLVLNTSSLVVPITKQTYASRTVQDVH